MKKGGPFKLTCVALGVFLVTHPFTFAESLSIEQAIARTLEHAPALKASQAELEKFHHLVKQSSVIENPTVAFDAENVGGSDDYTGTDVAEYTLSIEKSFELGGKRKFRKHLSMIDQEESRQRVERVEQLLVAETMRRFNQLATAQKREQLTGRQLEVTKHAADAVRTRQEVGSANILDLNRLEISVSLAEIQHDEAREQLHVAKSKLISLWGASNEDVVIESVNADLSIPAEIPSIEVLQQGLYQSLSWRLNELELERKRMLVNIEKSQASPDLTMSVGRRWFRADDAQAWNVGIAVDLPLFNRNQHAVEAATAASRQSNFQTAANRQSLIDELVQVYTALGTAWRKHQNLNLNVLSKARDTYRIVSEGFELGRYELLYLLEAQQTLFEIESTILDTVIAFYEASTDLYELLADATPETLIP